MAAKRIKDYLKEKKPTRPLMVEVDADLYEEVDRLKENIKWRELIEACLRKYLDEAK